MAPDQSLANLYRRVRDRTEDLTRPLSPEDQGLQSMPACSPAKWHLAHTTWFFETFLLEPNGVKPQDPRYRMLFNSYYEAIGPRPPRPERGLLSRPDVGEVAAYRQAVDGEVLRLLERSGSDIEPIIRLGCAHEEQHQELILTDLLHAFSRNPLKPAYREIRSDGPHFDAPSPLRFLPFDGGLQSIGAQPEEQFVFDNEGPRHRRWIEPFSLADRLVTIAELRAFVKDCGYETPSLWLSDGWDFIRAHDIHCPLYTRIEDGHCLTYSLLGERETGDAEPVTHLSFYEADAIARYLGGRLPDEAEWELAAFDVPIDGNFLDGGMLTAKPAEAGKGVRQLFGDAWEWTRSAYAPYPGYAPTAGALGEYNGKFMANQFVLRGGACLTPAGHMRASYRNFWPPDTRHQMTGLRLARDS